LRTEASRAENELVMSARACSWWTILALSLAACDAHVGPAPDGGGAPPAPDPCVAAGTCPPGVWTNVTPTTMSATVLAPTVNAFGPGAIVGDPARPSDLYVGAGGDGLWRSTDYGNTWTKINGAIPGGPIGSPIAVAGTTPATIWVSAGQGHGSIYKSIDGGATFNLIKGNQPADLYSIKVDPYDSTHLVSGLHEADGLIESIDGGASWNAVGGAGWPTGGISWYPTFLDTGDAGTTRGNWFAIAQDGASAITTNDQGAHWNVPNGLSGLQHPHGCSQIFQHGSTLFAAGIYGPGQGVYRSADLGANWTLADSGKTPQAVVWGTPDNVYSMWGWACSDCSFGSFETAPSPGDVWSAPAVPDGIGPNSVAVTFDGNHYIFIGVMWSAGIWRYIEP
jgi:hypothetical protein